MNDERCGAKAGRVRSFALLFAYVAVLAGYFSAIAYFAPPKVMLARAPVSGQELDAHAVQAFRAAEALTKVRESWSYDPRLLAGCPQGVLFDAGDKAWELWTFGLSRLGVAKGTAFNLFIVFVHLLVPLLLIAAGRLFGLCRIARFALVALGSLVWCFDSCTHFSWWSGAVSWAAVSVACLVPLGLFYRFLAEKRLRYALALAVAMALVHLVHPFSFFILVVPMTAMYARGFRSLTRRHHAAVAGIAVATLASSACLLLVDIRFWHYLVSTDGLGVSTLANLVTDYIGIVLDRADSGSAGMRSGFRFLALALAAASLFFLRKERDDRFFVFAVALGTLAALAYLGGCVPPLREVQPYRFAVPLAFFACVPAAVFVERLCAAEELRRLPARAYVVFAIAAVVALPRLVKDVLYFVPPLIPRVEVLPDERPKISDAIGFSSIGYPSQPKFRYAPVTPARAEVVAWVQKRAKEGAPGRYMVEDWALGELLLLRTRAEVLGGVRLRNLAHTAADFFRSFPRDPPPKGALEAFAEKYAVRYVITSLTHARFADSKAVLEKVAEMKPYMVFEMRRAPSLFAEGSGSVETAMNRISVRGTRPDEDVVLKYHWMETLACRPSCSLRREPLDGDPVGFIRIPTGHPADFEIVNRY